MGQEEKLSFYFFGIVQQYYVPERHEEIVLSYFSHLTFACKSLPFCLLVGNHSSGKSSFINYVMKRDIQKAGVAPTDDTFTVITPGPVDTGTCVYLYRILYCDSHF